PGTASPSPPSAPASRSRPPPASTWPASPASSGAGRASPRRFASARAFVARRPVDRRHLAAHGTDVRRELPAVMDGVEEESPQEIADRLLTRDLAAHHDLALARPSGVVEAGDLLPSCFQLRS